MAAFKDFHFKPVAIDVLMHRRGLLAPAFDLDARVREAFAARGVEAS
ncbi:DUF6892 domain-containing protein [Streptomyces sp. NPDC088090]